MIEGATAARSTGHSCAMVKTSILCIHVRIAALWWTDCKVVFLVVVLLCGLTHKSFYLLTIKDDRITRHMNIGSEWHLSDTGCINFLKGRSAYCFILLLIISEARRLIFLVCTLCEF